MDHMSDMAVDEKVHGVDGRLGLIGEHPMIMAALCPETVQE
jgi:hypothetical protein